MNILIYDNTVFKIKNIHIGIGLRMYSEQSMRSVEHSFSRKIAIIYVSISLNMCFGCSKEPSQKDGSFEYPQHMFWLRNKQKIIFSYALLSGVLTVLETNMNKGTVKGNVLSPFVSFPRRIVGKSKVCNSVISWSNLLVFFDTMPLVFVHLLNGYREKSSPYMRIMSLL